MPVTIAALPVGVTIVLALGLLLVMITLHELGHYIFAKRAGMQVTEFFVGFGPKLWSIKRGETEYGVKAILLGGYCKIAGMTNLEDIDPVDEPRAFRNATFWGKATTLVAGPASHFLIALALVFVILFGNGWPTGGVTLEVFQVSPGTAAAKAGLQVGDEVLRFDGHAVKSWDDLSTRIHASAGESVDLVVRRHGKDVTLHPTVGVRDPKAKQKVGFLGISPANEIRQYSVLGALAQAPLKTASITGDTIGAIGHVFSPSGIKAYISNFSDTPAKSVQDQQTRDQSRLSSPVGVGRVVGQAIDAGWTTFLFLVIAINLFVGTLNMVPLIPFDGGHLAVAAYEAIASRIRGRRVRADYAKLMPIAIATVTVLMLIFVSSLFLDIAHPMKNPF